MTTDIKSLVENLRKYCWQRIDEDGDQNDSEAPYEAADALEAMAGARAECERQYQAKVEEVIGQMNRAEAAEAEVERLKGVLEEVKRLSRLEDGVRMSAINQLADKTLEAKP